MLKACGITGSQTHRVNRLSQECVPEHTAAFEGRATSLAFEKKKKSHKARKQPCGWNVISMEINYTWLYKGRKKSRSSISHQLNP